MNTKQARAKVRKSKQKALEYTQDEVILKGRFWCNRNNQFIYAVACINRQDKQENGCLRCKQGQIVKEAIV